MSTSGVFQCRLIDGVYDIMVVACPARPALRGAEQRARAGGLVSFTHAITSPSLSIHGWLRGECRPQGGHCVKSPL